MKRLFLGVLLFAVLGTGGFIYRNAVEHPMQAIACPLDAEICPDGTSVSRTGLSCTFPVCPPPNVTLPTIGIAFALPQGFVATVPPDTLSVAAYKMPIASSTDVASIIIRYYAIEASSTALATIQGTAVSLASGVPVPATAFSSVVLGTHRFTVVALGSSSSTVDTAYYLARGTDVLRFDAVDTGVTNWNDPTLNPSTLPANVALKKLLTTLQGQ